MAGGFNMGKRLQFRRLLWLALLLILAFAGLGYRLVELQVTRHDEFNAKAQRMTQMEYLREPRRGDILDIKGSLLATCVPVKTVCADPEFIGDHPAEVAHALAPLLEESETEILQRLQRRLLRTETGGQPPTILWRSRARSRWKHGRKSSRP